MGKHSIRVDRGALVAVAAGGFLGGPARYGMTKLVSVSTAAFPLATFITNVLGSFLLGIVMVLVLERFPPTRLMRPFFATGFLGAFTTFSTYMVETDKLITNHRLIVAGIYLIASLGAGLFAMALGMRISRNFRLVRRIDET